MDTTFGSIGSGPDSTVYDIEPMPDGRLLISGFFSSVNGFSTGRLARLEASGNPDLDFDLDISTVNAISLLADGRIFVGGGFNDADDITRQGVALLHADGKPDLSFDSSVGASGPVTTLLVLPDGNVMIGGSFDKVGGLVANDAARFFGPGSDTRPAVGTMFPRSAMAGEVLRFTGSNFSGLTAIEFGGNVPAEFVLISETEIEVTDVVQVVAGNAHGLALLNDGTVTGWGSNSFGETTVPAVDPDSGMISGVSEVPGIFNFLAVARFPSHFITQVVSVNFGEGVAPVDLLLTGGIVEENLPTGSLVGTLTTMDYSPEDSFSYSLVAKQSSSSRCASGSPTRAAILLKRHS